MSVVAAIGAATALMAGTIGLVRTTSSACSRIDRLAAGLHVLAWVWRLRSGIFHLYTRVLQGAAVLGSGAVIHALAGEQDLRNMGGLKKYLPVTYWTFLIGALAIAGVPLLSGFFSKDEILFRTFTANNPYRLLLWGIGMVTSLLTATYMFRLVFLAFHGERRQAAGHAEPVDHGGHATHGSHDTHGHGHAPHDAPPSMAIPLIVLAIGSIFAGYVGVPHALKGNNRIERFLEPSFEASDASRRLEAGVAPAVEGGGQLRSVSIQDTQAATDASEDRESTELQLMALSSGVALAGIGIAWYFWRRSSSAADAMAARFRGLYTLLLHKYYVDELYDSAIVQPIKLLSTGGLWKGADAGLIDGAVNGVGETVRAASGALRRAQTGSVRTYAASLFLGVVLILGWYLLKA